jgi:hypothetical protein
LNFKCPSFFFSGNYKEVLNKQYSLFQKAMCLSQCGQSMNSKRFIIFLTPMGQSKAKF